MPAVHRFPSSLLLGRLTRPVLLLATSLAACVGKGPATEVPTETPAPGTANPADAADADLTARLERLSVRLEEARVEHHIPGMSVAVVKDDRVIFAEGFGLANLETGREATADSVFAVGSTSKAFTSALVAMQVEAGKMSWDESITTYIPQMQLATRPSKKGDPSPTPTVRDMLSHRSGFTRMGLLWAGGALSIDEVLAAASKAEPVAAYGEKFLYNNVTYASAGRAAARTADTTWAQMLQDRIFEPLGMEHSSATVAGAQADPNLAQGYRWREVTETHEAMPMRNLDAIGPAGAVNSTATDMAQWLRLQLGRGTYEGKTLLATEHLEETWKPNIEIGGGLRYGMGWMLGEWEGHRFVEHGGNIDGFAAEVAMAPDDGLGFVLLANVTMTPLQRKSIGLVFETMLGDPAADAPAGEDLKLDSHVGKYVANFGPFDDARFEVTAKDGTLFVDVPGQTNYELAHPDDDGRWEFALTNTIKVYFEVDKGGKYQVLHLLQGGMDFEMPRVGYSFPAEFTREEVAANLGRFRSDDGKVSVQVRLDGGRLLADIEGQMAFVLRKPGEDGRWRFRAKDSIAVSFREAGPGRIDALVIHEGADEKVLARVKTKQAPLPTVEQLLAKSKAKAFSRRLSKLGAVELSGTVRMPSSGIEGHFRFVFDAEHRMRAEIDLGRYGQIVETYDGEQAWSVSTLGPPTQALGKYLEQARLATPMMAGDWRRGFEDVSVEGLMERDGTSLVKVILRAPQLPPLELHIDPATGDVRSTRQSVLSEGIGAMPTRGTMGDYRKELGLRLPHRFSTRNQPMGETVFEVESVTRAKDDPATRFARPTDL